MIGYLVEKVYNLALGMGGNDNILRKPGFETLASHFGPTDHVQ